VAPEPKPAQRERAPEGLLSQFDDNLQVMAGKDQDEKAVLDLLKSFQRANERHDVEIGRAHV